MLNLKSAELGPPTRPLRASRRSRCLRSAPAARTTRSARAPSCAHATSHHLRTRSRPSSARPQRSALLASCRKELYEAWEVATRIDAAFENHTRVADLAAGHGPLAWMLLLLGNAGLDRRGASTSGCLRRSTSSRPADRWPESVTARASTTSRAGSTRCRGPRDAVDCGARLGALDLVLERVAAANAVAAVVPCCHSLRKQPPDLPGLTREALVAAADLVGPSAAIDAFEPRCCEPVLRGARAHPGRDLAVQPAPAVLPGWRSGRTSAAEPRLA